MTRLSAATRTESATRAGDGSVVVAAERLTKVFRDFWMRARVKAVNEVSFRINRGEVFGLLGPNGSGKSTTIKILLGLLHKTSGVVSVFGKLPTDVSVKRRIGYLPEESYLYPFLNARETLDYYGKLFELDREIRQKRIDELLDMVGLTAVQHRPVREYSKGMQRRIGIAQALINDPEFLILDEPTTGLDPIGTRQVKDLIIELGRRGKTVLLSSHLLSDVEDCVDRTVILYGGRIQREGTCDELLESRDRTVIETEVLDEATISAIDRLIRERTGGMKAIARVSHPRQKLEELFIDIVEKARASNLETSGAQHGGATAAFLRADQPEGEALVASLLDTGSAAPSERSEATGATGANGGGGKASDGRGDTDMENRPDLGVVSDLLANPKRAEQPGRGPDGDASKGSRAGNGERQDRPLSPPGSAAPERREADLGVIGSLLNDDKGRGGTGDAPERRP